MATLLTRGNIFLQFQRINTLRVTNQIKNIRKFPEICHTNHLFQTYNFSSKRQNEEQKLSLFQRFKQMYRDYWYVLVPVHLVTSAGWFGGFYYMAKSGIDIIPILESLHLNETIISPFKDSSLGYVAVSYALYKIATPVRYTVTLGGTTISINYLKKWGYIKPVPTRQELKEMYNEKKENILDSMKDKKDELLMKKEQLKDKTETIIDDMEKKIITKINDTAKSKKTTVEKP